MADHPAGPAQRKAGEGRGRFAAAGLASALLAAGTGELVAGLLRQPSLVVGIGRRVIAATPGWLERAAIALFGTADKLVLVVAVVTVLAGLGAVLGIVAARRFGLALAGVAALAVAGALAAAAEPTAAAGPVAATALAAAVAGGGGLRALLRAAPPAAGSAGTPPRDPRAPGAAAQPAAAGRPGADRRRFLQGVGTVLAAGAAAGWAGRALQRAGAARQARASVVLPPAAGPAPTPAGTPLRVPGLSPLVTPNRDFYRIDTALGPPRVDARAWRLQVRGMVERPFTLTYDDLLALPQVEVPVTLACVSNEVGGGLVGNAVWQGVHLADVLSRAGVAAGASQVVGRSVDGWTAGFPTALAFDGREALVAVAMNGEPLPFAHGFPARLIVPGLYGYVSATKWLAEIELATWEGFDAYWIPRGWSKEGPIKTQSRIDVPGPGANLRPGAVAVAGVAWAPPRGIAAVEVAVDDGPFQPARLGPTFTDDTWRQWTWTWEAAPGPHTLTVRATDGDGQVQTATPAPPRPDGATGHHRVRVRVG